MRDPGGGGSGSNGSGFAVDPATLRGAAGSLGTAYDDFLAVDSDFQEASGYDSSAFGDAGSAWSAFNSAWSYEVTTTKAALAELIQKLSATADNYSNTDYEVEKAMRGLFGG